MERVLVVYATRQGQTRKVAEHVTEVLRGEGVAIDLLNVAHLPPDFQLRSVSGVVLLGSVHVGKHERELVSFVKRQRAGLRQVKTAFVSVSLSQAGAEDEHAPQPKRTQAARDVVAMVERFFRDTGFRTDHVLPVAGALMYSKYNFLVRYVMRRIAEEAGASTDTTRDHEFTNWANVGAFARDFAERVRRRAEPGVSALAS